MSTASWTPQDAPTREILTITQLNRTVSNLLDRHIPLMWVRGEVSNFTAAASGHWYFTLKDSGAAVRTVMFRGRAGLVGFVPREGDQVEVRARVSLYEPRGDYQLQAESMRRAGQGGMFEAFLRLKAKLEAEGLFSPDRKRIPLALPRAIGVVTSLRAAALHDVITALARRVPHLRVIVYPAPVQGDEAPARLVAAIELANRRAEVDTLLLVRGGGSIEDLWAFNNEAVARAVADSRIPVVCGVGHETDFTIADFVADVRAPTPTAAAELAAMPRDQWLERVERAAQALIRSQHRRLDQAAQRLDRVAGRMLSPRDRLTRQRERLQATVHRLIAAWRMPQQARTARLAMLQQRLRYRVPSTSRLHDRLSDAVRRLPAAQRRRIDVLRAQLVSHRAALQALGPDQTLARGYAIVTDQGGNILRQAAHLRVGDTVTLGFAQGKAQASVTQVSADGQSVPVHE